MRHVKEVETQALLAKEISDPGEQGDRDPWHASGAAPGAGPPSPSPHSSPAAGQARRKEKRAEGTKRHPDQLGRGADAGMIRLGI